MTSTSEREISAAVIRIAAKQKNGLATFKRIYAELPNEITLSASDKLPSSTRNGEPMWHQIVRNIKSHDNTEGNAIFEGLLTHHPRVGYQVTNAGRESLKT